MAVSRMNIAAELKKFPAGNNIAVKTTPVDVAKTGNGDRFAMVMENIFTDEECDALVNITHTVGYEPALLNVGYGRQVSAPDVRKHDRCMIDSTEFAELLWSRVRDHMPDIYPQTDTGFGYEPTGLNERMRFLKYKPGDYFAPHRDGRFVHPDRPGEQSKLTLMLYLNNTGGNGGGTTFIQPERKLSKGRGKLTKSEVKKQQQGKDIIEPDDLGNIAIRPTKGMVLLFDHRIYHEGSMLLGGDKYCLRTDVMYRQAKPPAPKSCTI
eukprot:m.83259 g.83259  ORF g.83259 m.83259 type:complete len:266 (-) comp12913_c0_seq2:1227-2024(-)